MTIVEGLESPSGRVGFDGLAGHFDERLLAIREQGFRVRVEPERGIVLIRPYSGVGEDRDAFG